MARYIFYYPFVVIIAFVVLVVWAVVGFVFWIPFLARMTGLFTFAVLNSALTNSSLQAAEESLNVAITFWLRGFQLIVQVVKNMLSGVTQSDIRDRPALRVRWEAIVSETLLMIVWWFSAGLIWQGFVHGWWAKYWEQVLDTLGI